MGTSWIREVVIFFEVLWINPEYGITISVLLPVWLYLVLSPFPKRRPR